MGIEITTIHYSKKKKKKKGKELSIASKKACILFMIHSDAFVVSSRSSLRKRTLFQHSCRKAYYTVAGPRCCLLVWPEERRFVTFLKKKNYKRNLLFCHQLLFHFLLRRGWISCIIWNIHNFF